MREYHHIAERAKRLQVLRRRRDWLWQLITEPKAGRTDLSFIRAEHAALVWAIDTLEALVTLRRAENSAPPDIHRLNSGGEFGVER